jgi:hypothetical protein
MAILNLGNSNSAFSGSFSGSFKGDGSGLTNILNAQTASFVTLAQTASFVTLAQTASFVATAQTASYIEASNIDGTITSASYALSASYAVSASFEIIKEVSSSYADTASYVENAQTASYVTLAQTASFVTTAQTASYVLNAQTASFVTTAQTASYVLNAQTASFVTTAQTASYVLNAVSSSYALSSSFALTASHALNTTNAKYLVYQTGSGTDSIKPVAGSNTASGPYASIGGGCSNILRNSGSFIGGGKNNEICNGGFNNNCGKYGTIGGGLSNTNNSYAGTIAGGNLNTVSNAYATVAGGKSNCAASRGVVAGGTDNNASGNTSGILGGRNNTANANCSFIIGSSISSTVSNHTHVNNLTTAGNITGSNISASGYISASSFNATPNVVNQLTASHALTASYALGADGFPFSGNAVITGSLLVSGSFVNFIDAPLTASIISASGGITGSLLGTASTASYVEIAQTASYVTTAQTASFVLNAISSSYALTASYAVSASHEIIKEISSSYADTASYVETAQTASYILTSNIDQPFTDITASGNISASGIINGLSGSFKSLDVFVNLPITTGSKFRVGRMDSQFIGFGVSDYDNIILAKQDTDSNLPHNFILDRDFEGTGANNFKIQKNGIDQFVIDTSGNITASGDISASGYISASEFVGLITTAQTASYILASNIDQPFTNITASGNISASGGNIFGNVFNADTYVITPNVGRTTTTLVEFGNGSSTHSNEDTDIVLKTQGSGEVIVDIGGNDVIKFLQDDIAIGKPFRGLTIASGSWGYGDLIVSGSINAKGPTGNITASGNISASGDVITQKIGIVDGAGIGFGANFASGNEASDVQIFTDAAGEINFVKNSTTVLAINSGNNISINPSYFLDQPLNITNNITASGNISASGYISASNLGISGSATIDGPLTLTQANTLSPLTINNGTGTEIYFPGTTETNIKSEGLFQFKTSNNQGYGFGVNNVDFKAIIGAEGLATTATTVIADTYNGRLILRGNASPNQITGSIAMTGSAGVEAFISASSFNATPGTINELTASYAMTASTAESILPSINFKPVVTHTSNFTSTSSYAGHYNIVGGTLAITVTTGSTPTDLTPGMEWDFFQTSSGDSFTFTEGTGVEIISRNNQKKLTDLGSAGTLKYISGQTFHLIGDLTI